MSMILYEYKENNWLQIEEKRPGKLSMYMYWSLFERDKLKDEFKETRGSFLDVGWKF